MSINVIKFYQDNTTQHLSVRVMYKGSDGKIRMTSEMLLSNPAGDADLLINHVLYYSTEFVRRTWVRIEATTPVLNNYYGGVHGGHLRMIAEKISDPE